MTYDHRNVAGNEDLIKRLFNKVYSAIISEKIFCPPETAVYLAAYACQAKYGPAQGLCDPIPPVKELLPKSTLDNHTLTTSDWEERISKWHLRLGETSFLDAIVEYLDIAQDVELYGASIFGVESASKGRKWISLDAVGLNIYDSKRKPPTRRYVWSEITAFNVWENKIEIHLNYEPRQVVEFYVQNDATARLLEGLFKGSKELYSRRKKGETSSKYVRRSESNSSMRMRPHKLSAEEMIYLEQQITELELELPRRATDYEYAAWQVKDQLRQARGIETRLSLQPSPTSAETKQLLHRVAQIRVFLEQDYFKEKEPTDRLHRYRGNFAIRIGGALSARSDGYSSDIDSSSEMKHVSTGTSKPIIKTSIKNDSVWSSSKADAATPTMPPQPPSIKSLPVTEESPISSETDGPTYIDQPYKPKKIPSGISAEPKGPELSSMPSLPETPRANQISPPRSQFAEAEGGSVTYNLEAYPKFPGADRSLNSFTTDDISTTASTTVRGGPGYPEPRGSMEMDPPASVASHRVPEHDLSSPYARGRMRGQEIDSEEVQLAYRPPVQPKPKVAPRGTVDPKIVMPDYYANANANANADASHANAGQDPKFASLKVIQSGYTKKRVDLFEAL